MNKVLLISLSLFATAAFVSVSCAATTVPVASMNYEKAKTTLVVDANDFDGAIPYPSFQLVSCDAMFEELLALRVIHWGTDEEFYRNGYKAKLNKGIKEIAVPPDSNKSKEEAPIKQC